MSDVPLVPLPSTPDKNNHFFFAQEALKNNDFSTAIIECKKALQINPDNPHIYLNLAHAYEQKGNTEKETVFIKMAWDAYVHAFKNNLLTNEVIDGMIRVSSKLVLFDELISILKIVQKTEPENVHIKGAIKKVTTISLMVIPEIESGTSKKSGWIIRILFDFLMPLAGIFLILFGKLVPRIAPKAFINKFSTISFFIGLILFSAYLILKYLAAPKKDDRKNW